jgi:hypothetical protein
VAQGQRPLKSVPARGFLAGRTRGGILRRRYFDEETRRMAVYVDGYVLPVPKKHIGTCRKDPRITSMVAKDMPFDGKRMFWGGFKTLVELSA